MISVITVSYNAEKLIKQTLFSILKQDDQNFELILIDGKSNDKTIEIAYQLLKDFSFPKQRYKIVSEKDKGIYDGMNKGVQLAQGEYVIFMNCGDAFNNTNVLSMMHNQSLLNKADAIYGDTLMIFHEGEGLFHGIKGNGDKIMPFIHQSVMVLRQHLLNHPFDISYKILADREFFTWMRQENLNFQHCNIIVSNYDAREGMSESNPLQMAYERDRISGINKNKFYLLRKIILTCTIGLIQPIKEICPRWLLNYYFKRRRKNIKWL